MALNKFSEIKLNGQYVGAKISVLSLTIVCEGWSDSIPIVAHMVNGMTAGDLTDVLMDRIFEHEGLCSRKNNSASSDVDLSVYYDNDKIRNEPAILTETIPNGLVCVVNNSMCRDAETCVECENYNTFHLWCEINGIRRDLKSSCNINKFKKNIESKRC